MSSRERIEVSIIFEPTLTTRPPMRLSSTVAFILIVFPNRPASVFDSFSDCALVRALALVTSAVTSPFSSAIRARRCVIRCGSTYRRRFCAITASPRDSGTTRPILSATAEIARSCSRRDITGEWITARRSALSSSAAASSSMPVSSLPSRLFSLQSSKIAVAYRAATPEEIEAGSDTSTLSTVRPRSPAMPAPGRLSQPRQAPKH